jgi:hypothetical protein
MTAAELRDLHRFAGFMVPASAEYGMLGADDARSNSADGTCRRNLPHAHSFMIYGHARIPITSWLRDNAAEALVHAQEAGAMIMRLHKRPLFISALPITQHNTLTKS